MQILFAISVVCLLALIGAGVAFSRHIRSNNKQDRRPHDGQRDFAQHLYQATEDKDFQTIRPVLRQTVQDVAARKSWNQPPEIVTVRPDPLRLNLEAAEELFGGQRKSPQAHKSGMERLDWAYFNKDMGDLTDPYENPRIRANSRTSPRRY